jgi:hypothetical protein
MEFLIQMKGFSEEEALFSVEEFLAVTGVTRPTNPT